MYRLLIILFSLFACAPQGQEVITSSPDSPAAKETQETVAPQVTEPATPITETNWRSHESLDEVRDLVKAVNEGQMTRDAKRFTEPCATEQALESILLKDTDGRIRMFESSAGVDVWRMVRHYYDESGQLRFVMSTYAHSSAESKYLSRLYLNADGSTLYEPALEKLSERDGPGDPLGINEYSMKTADAAAAEHTRLVTACDTSPQACCCRHSDPAGAGLTRFSRDQGTCDGSIYMSGCVDSGICDVAKLTDVEPPSGTLKLTLPSGVTATVTGNPERVYSHGEGDKAVNIIYYSQPASTVIAQWTQDLTPQGFIKRVDEQNTEAHGSPLAYKKGEDFLRAEFEEGCHGSKGTCVWIMSLPVTAK